MSEPLAFPREHADPVLLPRKQRNRIRAALIDALIEVDLIAYRLEHDGPAQAREQRALAEPDLLLMDALGWEWNDPRSEFALNSAPADLLRTALEHARETTTPDEDTWGPLNDAIGFAHACVRDDDPAENELSASEQIAVTISRAERDVLRAAIVRDLSGIRDIQIELRADRGTSALQLRHRYFDELRALDDLGWGPDDPGETFAITMDPVAFINILQRLNQLAADAVGHHIDNLLSEEEAARSNASACDVIGGVLAAVARACSGAALVAAAA